MRRFALIAAAIAAFALPAAATASDAVQIRHVDLGGFPLVRVTAVAPAGSRPSLSEGGTAAAFVHARDFGSPEAIVLAVDNSTSMKGRPLQEAKRAAGAFLAQQHRAQATGLVAFGHEALSLTSLREPSGESAQTLGRLEPDTQWGTSLYDAVQLSVSRLERMSSGTRILVLLTDGRDAGSHSTLAAAVRAAQRANVVVYSIAAGPDADPTGLRTLAGATGGRFFRAGDLAGLGATYRALGRELDRTWQLTYLTRARPGDTLRLEVRAGGSRATDAVRIAGGGDGSGIMPASLAHSGVAAAAVVALAALLLAVSGAVATRRVRRSSVSKLVAAHLELDAQHEDKGDGTGRFEGLLGWTERSLDELPGSGRLSRELERSGLGLRRGYLPYLAGVAAIGLGLVVTIAGAGPFLAILAMLIGLASPFVLLRVAASRRARAFDRQLPDLLATIASTLRAGHGLRHAMRAIAEESTPPASEEFGRVLGEERLGLPLDAAIAAMCERIGSPDLEYVATAINVQSQVGGSLAVLFDTLSETVRERQRHDRKVRALTSMGRMSASVLVCLPIGLALLLTLLSPPYMAPLFTTSTGHVLIAVSLLSIAIGALVMKRIVSVRF
jgi:tight adherence protein B